MTGSLAGRGLEARVEGLDPDVVTRLVVSWEETQARYATARSARSEVIAELIDEIVARGGSHQRPVVLEVGCGPGTFARQLAARLPDVDVVGLDADPVLLALGRRIASDPVRLIETQVGRPGWERDLGQTGPVLAVVASAVLHYPPLEELQTIYRALFSLLRPGGLLVNADQFGHDQPEVLRLQRRTGTLAPPPTRALDWSGWWAELSEALIPNETDRHLAAEPHLGGDNGLSVAEHEAMLRSVGFGQVGVVWRHGPGAVLVAVR
jgi:SAM-dependent methyltransferase